MSKKKKVKLNYPKIIAAAVATIVVIVLVVFLAGKLIGGSSSVEQNNGGETVQQTTSANNPYSIRSNATAYQKEVYEELQDALKANDREAIAQALAKNFVADFFTLSNKTMKNDVGGTQFWSEEARLTLRTKAIDTFYTNLELYIADYGSENLPTVKEVTIVGSNLMDGNYIYAVEVSWTYEPNSVFDTSDFQKSAMLEITHESGTSYIYNFY